MPANPFTVVHTDAPSGHDLLGQEAPFEAAGIRFGRTGALDAEGLAEALRGADAVIVLRSHIGPRVAEALERCQVVVRRGVGFDTLDVPALTRHGVLAVNLPDLWTDEVANHALALYLALNRHLPALDRRIRAGGWQAPIPSTGAITGQTAGVVGLGRIGSAFARRCRSLGMRVLAFDPYVDPPESGVELVPSLAALAEASDVISVHTPLNKETFHLVDATILGHMRPGSILVNTSRGPVVDEQALIAALQAGRPAAAGMDTFEREPIDSDSLLTGMENVLLTPHTGFYSDASAARARQRVGEIILGVLAGDWPANVLNPELRTHPRHSHRREAKGAGDQSSERR